MSTACVGIARALVHSPQVSTSPKLFSFFARVIAKGEYGAVDDLMIFIMAFVTTVEPQLSGNPARTHLGFHPCFGLEFCILIVFRDPDLCPRPSNFSAD